MPSQSAGASAGRESALRVSAPGQFVMSPAINQAASRIVLNVENLHVAFPLRSGLLRREPLHAVSGVSFRIEAGECFGLVGESGSGKSTLARAVLRLVEPASGRIWLGEEEITRLDRAGLRRLRKHMQIIFQDPLASLPPHRSVGQILREPMDLHRIGERSARLSRVQSLLERVGLNRAALHCYPHEFSGGECQRIAIARALAVEPKLLIADEAVSALDVTVKAQIMKLLTDLGREFDIALLFISHDLGVIRNLADRVGVMYLGRLLEQGPVKSVVDQPAHPYTQALLAAEPKPDPENQQALRPLSGQVPSPLDRPAGCEFHPRCEHAMTQCQRERPALSAPTGFDARHRVACHLFDPEFRK